MKALFFLIFAVLFISCSQHQPLKTELAGSWQFQMDSEDKGIAEKWFNADLADSVNLPGSMAENGKGFDISMETEWTGGIKNKDWHTDPQFAPFHDPDNIRFPYWLQPVKKYTGAAWYQKKVTLPEDWNNKTVWLKLERPHWQSAVWINGEPAGSQNSLATPHLFNITSFVKTGENQISVRIDNRLDEVDPGHNSHSVTDHTQSNWHGITGEISVFATENIFFADIRVYPDVKNKSAEIKAVVTNSTGAAHSVKITVAGRQKYSEHPQKIEPQKYEIEIAPGDNILTLDFPLGSEALVWDEFNPNVYELSLEMESKTGTDKNTVDFGLREFKADGTRFTINGRPVFLRGTLECAIFPKTGYPPTDVAEWESVFAAVKNHGLNHVRFHSWCPPKAAFEAADKMGVYLQPECSSWANSSTKLGSGLPVDQYIWDESERIVKTYGNHPSFVMMAYGNEPGGPNHTAFLTEFVNHWKEKDNRRVYTGAAGWPVLAANQFHDIPEPRIQRWGEQLKSIINAEPPKTDYDWSDRVPGDGKPVVSHEIGQWCVYPDFKEMNQYTGVLKPKNFELFRESLKSHHMLHLADSFVLASGKLQALCYKADIEAALRTPGFAGFQLLDLHDFPGQGTALVGVLNPFWKEKGYISPEEYRRFCNTTVPLVRLKKRIFTEGETMNAEVEVAHFGAKALQNVNPSWKIISENNIVAEGSLGQREIPIGNAIDLGKIVYSFQQENRPRKVTLEVAVDSFSNHWDIWVYPKSNNVAHGDVKVVQQLSSSTLEFLKNGGKVLLNLGDGKVSPEMGGDVGVGFSGIFWNTAWTNGQKPNTLGILCNPGHPALELFPAEYHSNWQWWDAMSHADAIQLDSFPVELKPIVRIIDDWFTNRRLALIFEAKVGEGSLLVCGADLTSALENRPEARQLKSSLLRYMAGEKFNPKTELSINQILKILN